MKTTNKLTDSQIKVLVAKDKTYNLPDGEGLNIFVSTTGRKTFKLRYRIGGRANIYTIGEYPSLSLSEARKIKNRLRALIDQGIDPHQSKKEQLEKQRLEKNKKLVRFVIERYLEHKKQNLSKERYEKNYLNTLNHYVLPLIGHIKIDEVTKQDIIKIVKNVKKTKLKNDTKTRGKNYKAREVFSIVKNIFDFALHNDYTQINPAQRIDINQLIPKHQKEHMKAITDERIKDLYHDITKIQNPLKRLPLEYLALTAVRFGNLKNLKWKYIDFEKEVIIYPKEAMKIKNSEFRIPITKRVKEILEDMKAHTYLVSDYVFCSLSSSTKQISDIPLRNTIQKVLKYVNHTLHGFRSSFETIAIEKQKEHKKGFEVVEAQLHHSIGNSVTQSYLRSDFLEDRRELMQWWESYLTNI